MKIIGEVIRYIFENSDNNYRIFLVADDEGNNFTLNGYLPRLQEELVYEFEVEEVNHIKYGLQYKVLSYQNVVDNSKEGIVSYLSSNLFPGVGLIAAEKVYNELGKDCLDIIENPYVIANFSSFGRYIPGTPIKYSSFSSLFLNKII